MNTHPHRPLLLRAGMLLLACVPGLRAQSSLNLDSNMLLWKKNFAYRTEVKADISLTNTKIEVNMTDRSAAGHQPRSFHYQGAMVYNTELEKQANYNGSARRYYQLCDIMKSETNPLELKVEAGFWEVWAQRLWYDLPAEWQPHVEVKERNAEVFGGSYIIVRQKTGSPDLLGGGALELAFQSMGALSKQWFLLEWTRPNSMRNAAVKVSPAELRDKRVVATGAHASTMVNDVIKRESKLLYEAMLGFQGERKEGDQWVVEGETLDAMVHPTVKGSFRGSAIVRAEVVRNQSPVRTVEEINGFRLRFIPRGIVDGRSLVTDLRFEVETVDGGTHSTKLTPEDGRFSGEIWLDAENQSVRYGELRVDGSKYNGCLPRIGDLNAKIRLDADFHFNLSYTQSISPTEP
ncbi:hypothetical protein [Prosthecobacter sp.]|uniref:hypothetical protein n=1 Tax=Prosthecobacter sp. TaxID=1965333 RepID=UPI0037847511